MKLVEDMRINVDDHKGLSEIFHHLHTEKGAFSW